MDADPVAEEVKPKNEFIRELVFEFLDSHFSPASINLVQFSSWLIARNGKLWMIDNSIRWQELREVCGQERPLTHSYKSGLVVEK